MRNSQVFKAKGVSHTYRYALSINGGLLLFSTSANGVGNAFTEGRTEIHHKERSGTPSVSEEIVEKVDGILREDRRN